MLRVEQHDAELLDRPVAVCGSSSSATARGVVTCTRCRSARVSVRRPSSTAARLRGSRRARCPAPASDRRAARVPGRRCRPAGQHRVRQIERARRGLPVTRASIATSSLSPSARRAEPLKFFARPIVRRNGLHRTPSPLALPAPPDAALQEPRAGAHRTPCSATRRRRQSENSLSKSRSHAALERADGPGSDAASGAQSAAHGMRRASGRRNCDATELLAAGRVERCRVSAPERARRVNELP